MMMQKMKSIYLTVLMVFVCLVSAFGQWHEPKRVTEKFFPEPDIEINTPAFQKRRGFTTYEEMNVFLNNHIARNPLLLQMEIVGKTQKGKDIPLVTIRKKSGNTDKLNVLFFARVHGDEPAGTESMLYFIDRIVNDPSLGYLLDKLNFFIMPMVNIDGGESFSRRTANNIDMNRDQSKLQTPEAKALHEVVNKIRPHVSVDFHEFQPLRTDFLKIAPTKALTTPWDVMLLYSGNPNVPSALRNTVDNLFLVNIRKKLDEQHLTHHTYYSSSNHYGKLSIPIGGASPRSTSNAMALKNIISLLVETRGIHLGRTSLKRRTYGGYLAALAIAETAYRNRAEVLSAIEEAQNDRSDIAVRFRSEKVADYTLPFLDLIRNELVDVTIDASFNTRSTPTQTRPLPDAYYILPTEYDAIRILQNMGVEVTMLPTAVEIEAEVHTVLSAVESASEIGGIYPVSVRVETTKRKVTLPAGTFKVDTRQKHIRAATVLLEPESSNGFVNYRVIEVETGKDVPIYRFTK